MDVLVSIFSWLSQYIHPGSAVLIIVTFLVLYRFWLNPFLTQTIQATNDIQKVAATIADEKGNPILSYKALSDLKEQISLLRDDFDEHSNRADTHYSDLQHVASSEHWKTCDVSKCAHMQQIFNKLDKVTERFDQFDKRAEETRTNTYVSLQDIREGIKDLGKELADLAKSIISLLSNSLKDKEK